MIFVNKVRELHCGRTAIVKSVDYVLLADGRTEDLKKSASDREYQLRLLKEYGMV